MIGDIKEDRHRSLKIDVEINVSLCSNLLISIFLILALVDHMNYLLHNVFISVSSNIVGTLISNRGNFRAPCTMYTLLRASLIFIMIVGPQEHIFADKDHQSLFLWGYSGKRFRINKTFKSPPESYHRVRITKHTKFLINTNIDAVYRVESNRVGLDCTMLLMPKRTLLYSYHPRIFNKKYIHAVKPPVHQIDAKTKLRAGDTRCPSPPFLPLSYNI